MGSKETAGEIFAGSRTADQNAPGHRGTLSWNSLTYSSLILMGIVSFQGSSRSPRWVEGAHEAESFPLRGYTSARCIRLT
jgi:hypothetical protein